jgi:hypothetical protein
MTASGAAKRVGQALSALQAIPDPVRRLDAVRQARAAVEKLERECVAASRAAGTTWTEIGALYGLTKQGAQQRFRKTAERQR